MHATDGEKGAGALRNQRRRRTRRQRATHQGGGVVGVGVSWERGSVPPCCWLGARLDAGVGSWSWECLQGSPSSLSVVLSCSLAPHSLFLCISTPLRLSTLRRLSRPSYYFLQSQWRSRALSSCCARRMRPPRSSSRHARVRTTRHDCSNKWERAGARLSSGRNEASEVAEPLPSPAVDRNGRGEAATFFLLFGGGARSSGSTLVSDAHIMALYCGVFVQTA